jgi:hypothetical protein
MNDRERRSEANDLPLFLRRQVALLLQELANYVPALCSRCDANGEFPVTLSCGVTQRISP